MQYHLKAIKQKSVVRRPLDTHSQVVVCIALRVPRGSGWSRGESPPTPRVLVVSQHQSFSFQWIGVGKRWTGVIYPLIRVKLVTY